MPGFAPALHRSSSSIAPFALSRPASLAEAVRIISQEPDAVIVAGGLDVVNRMKEGLSPSRLVMLGGVPELARIGLWTDGCAIEIGAAVRHDDVATSPLIRQHLPDLAACWHRIANVRIRMQGSVAGNLLAGMPSYEAAVLLAAVDAVLLCTGPGQADAAQPIAGFQDEQRARPASPLALAIKVPLAPPGVTRRLVYDRSLRPALSVALCLDHAQGVVMSARAVLGGCHSRPVNRMLSTGRSTLAQMRGSAEEIAADAVRDLPAFTVPWFGHAGYRETVTPVLLARLIGEAAR